MDGVNVLPLDTDTSFPSDIGNFNVGNSSVEGPRGELPGTSSAVGFFTIGDSPIEGSIGFTPFRGSYSSAIGLFCIGRSPIGLTYIPNPDGRRVVFLLPEYPDQFAMPELEDVFMLPAPEGWSY